MRQGPNTVPANKLSKKEREKVIDISTSKKYRDLPPSQIVPMLADKGIYIASESTFYRILKEEEMLTHREKSKPRTNNKPEPLTATKPNQVYTWDITYLRGPISGCFFYLYMFIDIFSRKIVGWEVHENEDMEKSSSLIKKIYEHEGIKDGDVIPIRFNSLGYVCPFSCT